MSKATTRASAEGMLKTTEEPANLSQSLGVSVRAMRVSAKMSLSQLSRISGIAKGTLSQIEAGTGNPTIMTLVALAKPLGVTPSHIIEAASNRSGEIKPRLSGPAMEMELVHQIVSDAVWEFYDTVIPQTSEPIVSATHDGVEHLLMVEGDLQAGPMANPVTLKPGESFSFLGQEPHMYWSKSGQARVLLTMKYPLA